MSKSLSFTVFMIYLFVSKFFSKTSYFIVKLSQNSLFIYNIRAFFHLKKPDFLRSFRPKQITMHTDHAALYFTQLHW